jgi:hypothetical protein
MVDPDQDGISLPLTKSGDPAKLDCNRAMGQWPGCQVPCSRAGAAQLLSAECTGEHAAAPAPLELCQCGLQLNDLLPHLLRLQRHIAADAFRCVQIVQGMLLLLLLLGWARSVKVSVSLPDSARMSDLHTSQPWLCSLAGLQDMPPPVCTHEQTSLQPAVGCTCCDKGGELHALCACKAASLDAPAAGQAVGSSQGWLQGCPRRLNHGPAGLCKDVEALPPRPLT